MTEDKSINEESREYSKEEGESIEKGFEQMEMLYKSRCVQVPIGSNVTVREIKKEE